MEEKSSNKPTKSSSTTATALAEGATTSHVFEDFKNTLKESESIAVPVAAIRALTQVIKRSNATTMMGVEIELRAAADELKAFASEPFGLNTSISLAAGCELFLRNVSQTSLNYDNFALCKKVLIERGESFAETALRGRAKIAEIGHRFVLDGAVILTHARSRCVEELLFKAAETKNFSVIITECRPNNSGYESARIFASKGIPATVILDSAVGYVMEKVDVVIVGAEGVVENGGIVNKIGTHQIAVVAKAYKKPLYVATESYKFTRLYPLSQRDLPRSQDSTKTMTDNAKDKGISLEDLSGISIDNPTSDYTPPQYIKLLFTDLGILTPAAVSDELIKLYQ